MLLFRSAHPFSYVFCFSGSYKSATHYIIIQIMYKVNRCHNMPLSKGWILPLNLHILTDFPGIHHISTLRPAMNTGNEYQKIKPLCQIVPTFWL